MTASGSSRARKVTTFGFGQGTAGTGPPSSSPRLGRQVREVVLVLACRTALAHEPDLLVAWEVLVRPFSSAGQDAVRDAHPHRRERGSERALGTAPPCDGPPSLKSEH